MNDVSAFVLAGGRSTRMGRDKAFLSLDGETLLARACTLARSVTNNVFIMGDPAKFASYGSVVKDIYSSHGPLAGIHAALAHTKAKFNLMFAVDTPFMDPRFLAFMIAQARSSNACVVVPCAGSHLHPLCAVYQPEFAQFAETALTRGDNKVDTLFAQVETGVIQEKEIIREGFDPNMFRNLNTPSDWEAARSALAVETSTECVESNLTR